MSKEAKRKVTPQQFLAALDTATDKIMKRPDTSMNQGIQRTIEEMRECVNIYIETGKMPDTFHTLAAKLQEALQLHIIVNELEGRYSAAVMPVGTFTNHQFLAEIYINPTEVVAFVTKYGLPVVLSKTMSITDRTILTGLLKSCGVPIIKEPIKERSQ